MALRGRVGAVEVGQPSACRLRRRDRVGARDVAVAEVADALDPPRDRAHGCERLLDRRPWSGRGRRGRGAMRRLVAPAGDQTDHHQQSGEQRRDDERGARGLDGPKLPAAGGRVVRPASGRGHHDVAAAPPHEQRLLGRLEQRAHGVDRLGEDREPERHGHPADGGELVAGHGAADALGHDLGLGPIGARQQHAEALGAHPRGEVVAAHRTGDRLAGLAQDRVDDLLAVAVTRLVETIARILKDGGLNLRAGSSDVLSGIAKVNSYIAGTPKTPHLATGDRPGPLLYVAAELPWFQDEVMSYYWKRDSQGRNIDEPVDHNDHAMNTVKYMLSKLPDPSEIVVPEDVLPPRWTYWQEMNMDDYKRATGRIH